jgi:hypothetical protein
MICPVKKLSSLLEGMGNPETTDKRSNSSWVNKNPRKEAAMSLIFSHSLRGGPVLWESDLPNTLSR